MNKERPGLMDVVNYFGLMRGANLFVLALACALIFSPRMELFVLVFPLIMSLGWIGADVINNAFDREIDAITNPERDRMYAFLGKDGSIGIGALFLATSALLTVWTGSVLVGLVVLSALCLTLLYSVPPFRLRDSLYKPVLNGLMGSCATLVSAVYYSSFTPAFFALLLVNSLGVGIITIGEDMKDWAGDRKARAKTLPVVLGPAGSLKIIIPLYVAFYASLFLTGFLLSLHWLFYPASLLAMGVHSYFNGQWSRDIDKNQVSRKRFSDAIILFGLVEASFLLIFYLLKQ